MLFPSQTCHTLSQKGEIKSTLSPKNGEGVGDVLIYQAVWLFIKARLGKQRPEHLISPGPHRLHFRFVSHTRQAGQRGAEGPDRAGVLTADLCGPGWAGMAFIQGAPLWMILGTGQMTCFR